MCVSNENEKNPLNLVNLPLEILYLIFSFCDIKTLCTLRQVSKKLLSIISSDYIWLKRTENILATNQKSQYIKNRSYKQLSGLEKCKLSCHWINKKYSDKAIIRSKQLNLPWLELSGEYLWYSQGSDVYGLKRFPNGSVTKLKSAMRLSQHSDDVTRFILHGPYLITCGRDGHVCGWLKDSGELAFMWPKIHESDISSVSAVGSLVVTGGIRDKTVRGWELEENNDKPLFMYEFCDRVLNTLLFPNSSILAVGTSAIHNFCPLHVLDLQTGQILYPLPGQDDTTQFLQGCGILDSHAESPWEIITCGYDALARLWDLRTPQLYVRSWMDPFDSALFCLGSDNNMTFLTGSAHHGVTRLWDKRSSNCVQLFYVGKSSRSPVYSLAFDPQFLYVALDHSVHLLDFS